MLDRHHRISWRRACDECEVTAGFKLNGCTSDCPGCWNGISMRDRRWKQATSVNDLQRQTGAFNSKGLLGKPTKKANPTGMKNL